MDEEKKELVSRFLDVCFFTAKIGGVLIRDTIDPDLTEDQYFILRSIFKKGTCTSTELAKQFNVKKSAITAIITRLWEKGIVERRRDEKDRRVVYLSLTKEGKKLFLKEDDKVQTLFYTSMESFEEDELNQFIETYEKLSHFFLNKND